MTLTPDHNSPSAGDATDTVLLHDFVQHRSETAFRQLVDRHIHLVYAAALRQTRDPHVADDVTQAVFILLARKAPSVPPAYLAGWLVKTAHFASRDATRAKNRRQQHERRAAAMTTPIQPAPEISVAADVAPVLDEALAKLSAKSRTAVCLRFLENRSLADVGRALDVSENAAQKLVNRALPKLRALLSARGVAPAAATPATLAAALQHLAGATLPPAPLAAIAASSALSTTATTAVPLSIANGAAKMMTLAKLQSTAAILGLTLLGTAVAATVAQRPATAPTTRPAVAAAATVPATQYAPRLVIRPLERFLRPVAELTLPVSADPAKPAVTYVSLDLSRTIDPPPFKVELAADAPYLVRTDRLEKWLLDNDVNLVAIADAQTIRLTGVRCRHAPDRAAGTPDFLPAATAGSITASLEKVTWPRDSFTFAMRSDSVPFGFYADTGWDSSAAVQIVGAGPRPPFTPSLKVRFRLLTADPTRPKPGAPEVTLTRDTFQFVRVSAIGGQHAFLHLHFDDPSLLKQAESRAGRIEGGLFLGDELVATGNGTPERDGAFYFASDLTPDRALAVARRLNDTVADPDNPRLRFLRSYSLRDGQVLRVVPPADFPSERAKYARFPETVGPNDQLIFFTEQGWPRSVQHMIGPKKSGKPYALPLCSVLESVAGLRTFQFDVTPSLRKLALTGDLVADPTAPPDARVHSLPEIITQQTRRTVTITKKSLPRPTIVVTGEYTFTPLPVVRKPDAVHLSAGPLDQGTMEGAYGEMHRPWPELFDSLGNKLGLPFADLSAGKPETAYWVQHSALSQIYDPRTQTRDEKKLRHTLDLISRQTGLNFQIENRPQGVYLVTEQ